MNSKTFVLTFVVVVFVAGGLLYLYNPDPTEFKYPEKNPNEVICTADAILCPDGSYVGRSGPNCEFLCPSAISTSSTKAATTSTSTIISQ